MTIMKSEMNQTRQLQMTRQQITARHETELREYNVVTFLRLWLIYLPMHVKLLISTNTCSMYDEIDEEVVQFLAFQIATSVLQDKTPENVERTHT